MELNQKTPKRGRASTWSPEDLQKALEALRNKYGLNEVSRLYGIPKPTLKRHLDGKNKFANGNVVQRGRMTVLPAELENELVSHINQLEGMLFGLTRNDIRCLAYQIAEKNGLSHRFNKTEGMAGKDWFRDFKKRHNLSLRQPEATSLARSTGFNKIAVNRFFDKLESIITENKLDALRIFNTDETALSTVQKKQQKVVSLTGRHQVGKLTSAERGLTTTAIFCANAAGNAIPPMLVYKRKRMKGELLDGAPPGTIAVCNESGWMTADSFSEWMDHFINSVKPSKEKPVLLILDGHTSHSKNLQAITAASNSCVIMLSLPPHTTHKLQPLDVSFFKPLQSCYVQESDKWLFNHPGRGITVFQVATILGRAYPRAASVANFANGFLKCGIWPCNRHIFTESDFETSICSVINIPVEPIPSTSNSQHDQLLVQSSSDSSTIVATSPLTSSNEPRFGATAQSSIHSNFSHLELSISAYNAIPTEPDGRCFFRSIRISLHEHLQLTDRDSSGVVCSLQVKIQEKALADSLRAQVVDYICKNIEHYTDLDAATLCADMPHAKFDNIFERLDSISRPNTMVGELEIIATTKLLRKPIVIMNATSNVVLKYGMNDFPSSPAVVIRFTNIGDDVGHYDCLIPSRQSKSKYIPVTAISPISVKEPPPPPHGC
ncbi:uncharacterized protein LOC129922189 [Biomphalaria glabrata]|uniref:Uncharacterized protein LOC129922189 n=1 Tax=Biomphalaria glabrata TaxID=6526 RepID=A0A9W2YKK4_BIOGL|nr:uncharacterized protein LOC129922189 [Biomphalaria glabrata]